MLLKQFVTCMYPWTALNKAVFVSIFKFYCQKVSDKYLGDGTSYCIIENLSFSCVSSTMKEVVFDPYNTTIASKSNAHNVTT